MWVVKLVCFLELTIKLTNFNRFTSYMKMQQLAALSLAQAFASLAAKINLSEFGE
jgi:hypothetical protein